MEEYHKPLPEPTEETKEFWEGCRRGELLMQRCRDCGTFRFFPRPMCHVCNSFNREWAKVSGRGKVYTWIVVHRSRHPAFAKEVPYVIASVQLDEQADLRIIGNLEGIPIKDIKLDMPVEVFFDRVTEDIALPKWRPASPETLEYHDGIYLLDREG